MKKWSLGYRVSTILIAIVLILGMFPVIDAAETDTWDQHYLITQAVAANGAPVSAIGNAIEYTMLKGNFFGGTLSQFTTMSSDMLGNESQPVCVWPWQIKVTGGTDFVLKITAKKDLYMNLWQYADTTSTWVGNTQISYVVENGAGQQVTLKTLSLEVNVPVTKAQYDTRLHLAEGDTAYIIYHKTDGASSTYPSNMRVTVDPAAYDPSLRTYFGTEPEETEPEVTDPEVTEPEVTEPEVTEPETVLKHTDMVSAEVAAAGAPVTAAGVTYQYLYGNLAAGEVNAFTEFSGNGSGGTNDIVGNSGGDNAVWRWQWRAGNAYDTLLKITAAENLKLSLSHPDSIPTGEIWAFHSVFTLYTANAEGELVKITEYDVESPMNTADIDEVIHVAAGDSIYLVYGLKDYGNGQVTAGLMPYFTVDPSAYDASLRTEFTTEPEETEPEITEPEVTEPEETEPDNVLKHTDMVSAEVAAAGAPVTAAGVTYQYLYGNLEAGELNAFTQFSGNGSGGTNDIVGNSGSDNAVWRWQWRAGNAYDTLLQIKATENLKLSLSHPDSIPTGEIWAFHSEFILYTADESGNLVELTRYAVESPMNTADIDEVIHMAAGDSLYLVYGLKDYGNGQVTAGLMPYFTVDTEAYDASLRTEFTTEPEETEPEITEPEVTEPEATEPDNVLKHTDMVSAEVAAGGKPVIAAGVTYQYLYGNPEKGQLKEFTQFSGNGSGGTNDIVGNANGDNAVWRWQWRAGNAYDTLLKITAAENLQLSLSHPDSIPTGEIWAFHSSFILYAVNGSGKMVKVAEYDVKSPMNTADIDEVIHMAAGDSIYLVYGLKDYGNGQVTAGLMPYFTVDTTAYDAALRTDFSAAIDPEGNKPASGSLVLEHPEMVSAQVAAKGQAISRDLVDFQYLTGDFYNGKLSGFTSFTGAGQGATNDILGNPNGANAVWRWQWRCGSNQTVLRITAKKNVAITLSAADAKQQWAAGSAYFIIAENANGEQALLRTVEVTTSMNTGGPLTVHLAKGQKMYIVYGNSYGAYEDKSPATSEFIPVFSISTASYNGAKAPYFNGKVAKPVGGKPAGGKADDSMNTDTHEEIFESDLVSEEVQLQGAPIEKGLADFQFLIGDFFRGGELLPFTEFAGTGNYEAEDSVGNPNGTNFAYRWQWRTMSYTNTILKITAKKNISLTVDQRSQITDEQWATHTTFAYVVESVEKGRLTVRQMEVKSQMDSEYMKTVVHLAEGESLYIVYYVHTGMDGHATAHYNPYFIMDTEAYDESLRTDFSVLTALSDAKEEKTQALQSLLETMLGDGTVYSETNAEKLAEIVSEAIEGFARLGSAEEVQEAYDAAVEKMEAVQTLADEAAELADYKERAKQELSEFVQKKDYSKENWQKIQEIIEEANSDIDAANKAASVSQVLAYAKAAIRKVETRKLSPVLLGGMIGGGVLVLGIVALLVRIFTKKKKKQA